MNLRYCIRTCDARKDLASSLFNTLREQLPPKTQIDIVNDYIGKSPIVVFGHYLKDMLSRDFDFDYLVTLEDDAILNDHLDFNLKSCKFLQEEDVGCLQLSISSSNDLKSVSTFFDSEYKIFQRKSEIHYSCGLVFSKDMISNLQQSGFIETMLVNKSVGKFDITMTKACIDSSMLLGLHYPALVASMPNVPSAMGNTYTPSDELFSKSWKNEKTNEEYQKWATKLKSHSIFCARY